jgi:lipopolysaccharide export system permease protein
MKTIRRLIYREVLAAVVFVAIGFLSLFFFFDFVDELPNAGRGEGYRLTQVLAYVTLMIPNHLYELLPIAVLIGTIFVMARLAQSSEYTILRTSGLGPWRALRTLLMLGMMFAVITFATGDYVAPASDRTAQLLKARLEGRISIGQTGAWLKEKQPYHTYNVNVRELTPEGDMRGVKIFESDSRGFLVSVTQAAKGRFADDGAWQLEGAERSEFTGQGGDVTKVESSKIPNLRWPTEITPEMVSVALLRPDRMGAVDLFEYIRHLEANGQTSQRYEIEFWRKVFYPLSCMVMVVLALPFAYLHFRTGGITGYVFGGVLVGISFFLLNNVFGYIGNLQSWRPWLTAAAPGLIYTVMSLGAFGWLVLRR